MMLIRYKGELAGFVGATRYSLTPQLQALPAHHTDRRRLDTVCRLALEYRATTGREIGTPIPLRRRRD